MFSFARLGNDLYTGRRSIDFVGKRRLWYAIAGACVLISLLSLGIRGLNPGIEFRGGSEFQLPNVKTTSEIVGQNAVSSVVPGTESRVSKISSSGGAAGVRVQTEKLTDKQSEQVEQALIKAYGVTENVSSSFVGPSWGSDISRKAIQGLLVFLLLVALTIAGYFRTWKMSVAGLVALVHDLILTVGVYSLVGFEVTPASVIGFLTILGYSLYDTVVVFDKVRENTAHITATTRRTYGEAANLAINQTLVRSINTSVVALLPVASILFIGAFLLGAGTLKDISLALFVGIAAGTYSSIFIASPLLVDLRRREPELIAQEQRVLKKRASQPVPATVGAPASLDDDADGDDVPAWGTTPVTAGSAAGGSGAGESATVGGGSRSGASGGSAGGAGGQRRQPRRNQRQRPGGRR